MQCNGATKEKWQDEVLKGTRVMGVTNWTKVVRGRWAWHDMVEKLKTHKGL